MEQVFGVTCFTTALVLNYIHNLVIYQYHVRDFKVYKLYSLYSCKNILLNQIIVIVFVLVEICNVLLFLFTPLLTLSSHLLILNPFIVSPLFLFHFSCYMLEFYLLRIKTQQCYHFDGDHDFRIA